MSQIDLSETQAAILGAACARQDAAIFPLTVNIKGGAVTKVVTSLMRKGLVELAPKHCFKQTGAHWTWIRDPEHGEMSYRATRLAFETLGIDGDANTGADGQPNEEAQNEPATEHEAVDRPQVDELSRHWERSPRARRQRGDRRRP